MTDTTGPLAPTVDIRRADDRLKTGISWLDSKHSFSFGQHYDPANTHHGLLLVNNDDTVTPGTGFDTHPHRDMEIVTWVLRGSLVHQDSTGHSGVIYPGLAQRMSAGRGILHSEKNDSWTLTGDKTHRARAFRSDVGGSRRGRDHPRLSADRDRRRTTARRPGDHRLRHARARGDRDHGSATATRHCTVRDCRPASPSNSPKRPTCTCSSRAARSAWRVPAPCTRATRCGSPPPAVSRSPPRNRPRSCSGRCTPPSPAGSSLGGPPGYRRAGRALVTSPAPRGLPLTFYAVAEPEPGPGWQGLFSSAWPAYRPYITGCSQAVHLGVDRALVRNYDYAPELLERVVLGSSFTGRPATGTGFGIPLVLRYVLEVCDSAAQARHTLARPAPGNVGAPRSRERWDLLASLVGDPGLDLEQLVGRFLEPPLHSDAYELGFGTLYTAVYRPAELALEYRWPGSAWKHTIGSFADGQHEVVLGAR